MVSPNRLAEIAAVIGDPARASMLTALMNGRALTAGELAVVAGITPQTASTHLNRMVGAGLIALERQGRHRYHRLSSPAIAQMLEGLMLHAIGSAAPDRTVRTGPRDGALRHARTCYDHIAGRLGVAIADAAVTSRLIAIDDDAALVTPKGARFFAAAGILSAVNNTGAPSRRPLCRACLDWSERRPHLAGRLGAAICTHAIDNAWVRPIKGSRALAVTPKGHKAFREILGVRLD